MKMSANKKFKSDALTSNAIHGQSSHNTKLSENNTVIVSSYFTETNDGQRIEGINKQEIIDICSLIFANVIELNQKLSAIKFSKPVDFVYNPTEYACDVYKNYIQTYCSNFKSVMFLGMNPGPWGMSQTGVPFGEINAVRDWLKLSGNVLKPPREAPSRPILGFDCKRSEISGKRFWSLVEELSGTPENFFLECFVHNYCPLQLLTASGKNVTPAELKISERQMIFDICDISLLEVLKIYKVKIIVCIGKFVETRAEKLLKSVDFFEKPKILTIPHPSPRTIGNNNWQEKTAELIKTLDILRYFKPDKSA